MRLTARRTPMQIKLGDPTMSVLEIWGAEYQENDCLLLKQEDCAAFEAICARERCSMQASFCLAGLVRLALAQGSAGAAYKGRGHHIESYVKTQVLGEIDGSGRIMLVDPTAPPEAPTPVDLDLEKVTKTPPLVLLRCDLILRVRVWQTGLGALLQTLCVWNVCRCWARCPTRPSSSSGSSLCTRLSASRRCECYTRCSSHATYQSGL